MDFSKKWQKRFIKMAHEISTYSKDRSTGVGCVIVNDDKTVVSMGYNGFPRGVDDCKNSRHERPVKYLYTEHAERNAIYNACKTGVSLNNCTLFCTMFPCADCTRGIIQSGIKKIYSYKPESKRWDDSHKVSMEILKECNIEIEYIEY